MFDSLNNIFPLTFSLHLLIINKFIMYLYGWLIHSFCFLIKKDCLQCACLQQFYEQSFRILDFKSFLQVFVENPYQRILKLCELLEIKKGLKMIPEKLDFWRLSKKFYILSISKVGFRNKQY